MVLHSESEGIIAQFYLLDDVVGCAPGFDFKTGAQFIDRLMMGAIYFFKSMARFAIGSEPLDVVRLLIRQVMAGNVEMEGTTEGDIEALQSFANRENRKPAFDRILEVSVKRDQIDLKGQKSLRLGVALWHGGLPVDVLPAEGFLEVALGDEQHSWPIKD